MKNYSNKIGRVLCTLAIFFFSTMYSYGYDQVFPSVKLRHESTYFFGDEFHAGSNDIGISKLNGDVFFEPSDYNRGSNPTFNWTNDIVASGYQIKAYESKDVVWSATPYTIKDVPTTRKSDNLYIVYDFEYYEKIGSSWVFNPSHTEYQPYTITWCGDGVRDDYIDQYLGNHIEETCDPNDTSKAGWGTGGCSNSCEPITAPAPAQCTSASVSPTTGVAPLTSNISCSGQNNSTYKIQVLDGSNVVRTFNSRTATYKFDNEGNYTVKCFVDENITSNACTKTVKVDPAPPAPSCDGITVSQNSGNPGLTSSFNCSGTSADSYKVRITKDGSTERTFNVKSGSYTFNSVGNYEVQCFVNNTVTSNACKKTVTIDPVPVLDYDLALTKKLVGSDTSFKQGDRVTFNIRVTNQGEVASNNATITDYIPNGLTLVGTSWTKSGNKATTSVGYLAPGASKTIQIKFEVNGTVIGSIRNFAEISSDSGDDCDSTPDNINGNQTGERGSTGMVDDNIGNGCNPGGDEDDHDFADITVEQSFVPVYDLALKKTLASSGELTRGEQVTFNIRVFNQGNVDSGSVEITDYIPTGLILNDSSWTQVGGNAVRTISNIAPGASKTLTITFTIADNAPNNITNIAEISDDSGDDCDSVPNAGAGNDGVATDNDTGVQCEPGGDEDDHDPETITVGDGAQYDLALKKVLGSSGPFVRGGDVTFNIVLENQGDIDANYIQVTDYIPAGLILNDNNWTQAGGNAVRTVHFLAAGASKTLPIRFTIADNAPNSITNIAEISNDDGDDCDSTPNAGANNDGTPIDNDTGTDCDTGGDEDDHDPETITVGDGAVYDLALRKILGSTGPFIRGGDVTFKVTVFNQGNVDSGSVEVTDYIPTGLILNDTNWTQSGRNAVRTISNIAPGTSRTLRITFTIADNAPNNITNIAEITDDSGEDCDSTPDSDGTNDNNLDNSIGSGCGDSGEDNLICQLLDNCVDDEDDSDPETITVGDGAVYDLALRKTLTANQAQPFTIGGDVTFDIKVFNQGNVDSGSVEITDYIPTGLILNDSSWNQVGGNAVRTISNIAPGASKTLTITFTIADNAPNNITNIAEITDDSGDDCDSTPDSDGTNDTTVDNDIGNGCDNPPVDVCDNSTGGTIPDSCDEDDSDPETIIVVDPDAYDLALRKTVSGNPELIPGSLVTFDIEVFNQGTVDSGAVEITDYIPVGLTLTDNTWTQAGNLATKNITNIPAGGSEVLSITFTIQSSIASGTTITNFAEISDDSGDDCDSITDNDVANDGNADDNNIGAGCNPGGDKDDHDPETIVITLPTTPSINIVKTDANALDQDSVVGNDSQLINSGDRSEFKITVTNNGTEDLKNIVVTDALAPQCAGLVTLPGTYVSSWENFTTDATSNVLKPGESFSYTCEKANTSSDYTNIAGVTAVGVDSNDTVNDSDTSVVDVKTTGGGSNPGGGGVAPQCRDIIRDVTNITCVGSSTIESFMLYCGEGDAQTKLFANAQKNGVTGRQEAVFSCGETVARCFAHDDDNTTIDDGTIAWRTSNSCEDRGTDPFCGNGIVETGEQCDISGAPYGDWGSCGKPLTPRACKLPTGGGSNGGNMGSNNPDCKDDNSCLLTFPNGGEIVFGPRGSLITGHDVNPLEVKKEKPYLYNNSDYDLSFDELCVLEKDAPDNVVNGSTFCLNLNNRNRMIYAYETITLDNYPTFTTNKGNIVPGEDFGDAEIITTIRDGGLLYDTAYFAGVLDVRVAKPAVATIGGGTSYVANSQITGDIYKTTQGVDGVDAEQNKNFVGASASDSAISSYSEVVTQAAVIEDIKREDDEYKDTVDSVTTSVSTLPVTSPEKFKDVAKTFNGLSNVWVVENENVIIEGMSDLPPITESTTFIIDGGNLEIREDIVSNKNIAFVVRGGGGIKIKGTVENLDGTYISIPADIGGTKTGGFISSGESGKQLTVNGSLYGDLTDLVANRYYVSQDTTSGQLSVGTVVSFGSQIFTKPAPLVSQFIGEYLESEKVAR